MHDKTNLRLRYSTFTITGFFVTAGILTMLPGCRGRSGENGTNGITGGAFIASASCDASDTTNSTLNINVTNTTAQVLTLKEGGAIFATSLFCNIFTSTAAGSTPAATCSVVASGSSNGTPVTAPLPIGTTSVALTCNNAGTCVDVTGIACEGQAYAPPDSPTPGLAFELDNIFGTLPPAS